MSPENLTASLESVRRLAVRKQHLAGPTPTGDRAEAILSVVRDVAFVQWDPVTIVAPSHLLSLRCRLDDFRPADLDRLLWNEKKLFQHWTPIASIVLTEDYPLYRSLMDRYPDSMSPSWGSQRARAKKFLTAHAALRRKMLAELRGGPLQLGQFADHARTKRSDGDWSPSSDVSHMLYHLTMSGEVMVVGHEGSQNLWGLSDRFLPADVDRAVWSAERTEREAAQRAIRALGTATPREIVLYFVRGRYEHLTATLARLQDESLIHRVTVDGLGARDERYIHHEDLRRLESAATPTARPRVALVPPFDSMVGDQGRLRRLFAFDYVREQFLPREKRRFGTYVLPIVWDEKFIGRIDPRLDKANRELVINAVHAEADAPHDPAVAEAISDEIGRLAEFVGAKRVRYTARVPARWKQSLR
jgi:uncharacterized protein